MYGGILVEWPVFDGLQTAGRVTKAKAEVRRHEVALKKLEQQIQLEVTEALLNVQSSREFVESQLGNVENAEEALRLFEKKGIPSFRTPEACGRALGYLVRYGNFLNKRKETGTLTGGGDCQSQEGCGESCPEFIGRHPQ